MFILLGLKELYGLMATLLLKIHKDSGGSQIDTGDDSYSSGRGGGASDVENEYVSGIVGGVGSKGRGGGNDDDENEHDAQKVWLLDESTNYGSSSNIYSGGDGVSGDSNSSGGHVGSSSSNNSNKNGVGHSGSGGFGSSSTKPVKSKNKSNSNGSSDNGKSKSDERGGGVSGAGLGEMTKEEEDLLETGSVKSDNDNASVKSTKSNKSATYYSQLAHSSSQDNISVASYKSIASRDSSIFYMIKGSAKGLYRTVSLEDTKYQYVGLSESVTVSFALCMTNIAAGIAAGVQEYPLPLTVVLTGVMTYLMTYLGQFVGANIGQCIPESVVTFIVGIILLCIGLEIYLPPW